MSSRSTGTTWLVASYEQVRASLADPRLSNDPRNAAHAQTTGREPGLLTMDRPEHTRLRRAVAGLFSPGAVEAMRERIARVCAAAVDRLARRGEADLVADYAVPVPVDVIHELLGIPVAERLPTDEFVRLFRHLGFDEPHDGPSGVRLGEYVHRLIAHKRAHPGPDVTTALIQTLDSGGLRHEGELRAVVLSLLGAGHATTVPFLGAAALRLIERPALLAELRERPELWRSHVEEVLRFDSVAQLSSSRYAVEDLTIGGTRIAKGDTVLLSLASANRDSARYPDADRFLVDRTPTPHLALGHGPHLCLGAHLVKVEGSIALATLFDRLTDLRLRIEPDRVVWTLGPTLRGPAELPVTFRARGTEDDVERLGARREGTSR
ncbi:cytochrome P450 [Actinosynnema pretiosum subsp. pretiosum]|uniref:Cytochrome P450 n=1 Tax=Actinosynnema pretiosum subsp. pretiosum TaxID=103721 RepID=A0AA45R3Z2_9PSEU|nr:cytochrome P450 [Actinosynnema pretiosum subsp. pretiosum]